MKRSCILMAAVLVVLAALAGCGDGTSSGKVLVDINGDKITEGDLNFLGDVNPRLKAQISNPAGQKRILDNLVEQEVLYQQAVKEGLNRDSKVKAKIDLYRKVIIAQSLVDSEIEKAAKKYYDTNAEEFKKLKLSQIMVKYASPEEMKNAKKNPKEKLHGEEEALKIANELKAKIDKGEAFDKVAAEGSEDVATKSRGGDLGLVSKNDNRLTSRGMGPILEKAYEMKVGEVAGPIKTSKGYHIITVTRGVEPESFDEAKEAVMFKVRGDARNDLMAKLKKESKISYPEEEKIKEEAKKATELAKKPGEAPQAAKAAEGAAVPGTGPGAAKPAEATAKAEPAAEPGEKSVIQKTIEAVEQKTEKTAEKVEVKAKELAKKSEAKDVKKEEAKEVQKEEKKPSGF